MKLIHWSVSNWRSITDLNEQKIYLQDDPSNRDNEPFRDATLRDNELFYEVSRKSVHTFMYTIPVMGMNLNVIYLPVSK